MRVLCCGDRDWSDEAFIYAKLAELPDDTIIIHGACRGADLIAAACAHRLGVAIEAYPAQWKLYGRAAGPIRNEQMLNEGRPDKVFAFHDHLNKSRGTRDMIDRAESVNIPTTVFSHKKEDTS